jgi:hypothetical protein
MIGNHGLSSVRMLVYQVATGGMAVGKTEFPGDLGKLLAAYLEAFPRSHLDLLDSDKLL